MTNLSIDDIKSKHADLSKRAYQGKPSKAIVPDVKVFISEIREAGADIPPGNKRELLRSMGDAWGNYIFRETGVFPPTDLKPYEGPLPNLLTLPSWVAAISRPVWILILAGALLAVIVASSWISSSVSKRNQQATQIAVDNARNTEVALAVAQTEQAPDQAPLNSTPTSIGMPTLSPSPTPTPTFTPTPTETLAPDETPASLPTTESVGVIVQLTSLQDGDSVIPKMSISGTYENLQPGWSIHVLLEPLSEAGKFYPQEESWVVAEDAIKGEWTLDVAFQIGADLAANERYNISVVAVQDDRARAVLNAAVEKGLDKLPSGVIPFPRITTVTRNAYTWINEVRLVYSSYLKETNNSEILTASLDGTDIQRIPNPSGIMSLHPNISPSGERIVYVGQERTSDGKMLYLLGIMDSNGENRKVIAKQSGAIEHPVWSPDGNYIAYTAVVSSLNLASQQNPVWNIFLYDVEMGTHYQLTKGTPSDRGPAWMPEGDKLVFSSRSATTNSLAIFTVDIETGEIQLLLDMALLEETHPAVSPDGKMIAYSASSSPEDNGDIYVFELATTKITQLTGLKGDDGLDQSPVWYPDGETIYFVSFRVRGAPNIWAINIDGSDLRQITFGDSDSSPDLGSLNAYWLIEP
ncbi:MAG: hypothetical protein ABIG63_01530 [Chloroflexota bacterium]